MKLKKTVTVPATMEGNENKVLVPGRMLNPSDSDVYLQQKVIIVAQAKLLSEIEF